MTASSLAPVLSSLLAARARLLALPPDLPARGIDDALREGLSCLLDDAIVREIGRTTPALLDVVRERDAVHPVRDEADLARRLDDDRRICALVHPARPDAALAFIELALVRGQARDVDALLDPGAPVLDPARADTGVFYGISNTEPGAAGLAVGSLLIERMLAWLPTHVPHVRSWVTLSPIPALRRWLERLPAAQRGFALDDAGARRLPRLAELARRFVAEERDAHGRPLDPVARFHLGNGAVLDDVLLDASRGPRADAESLGVMASYAYVRAGERVSR